jgi:hypothetical protein
MPYTNPSTMIERAVRAYLIGQGKGTADKCYISLNSYYRTANSRTFLVRNFMPNNAYRPAGVFQIEIQHVGEAIQQDNVANPDQMRVNMDNFVGATMLSMFAQSDGQGPLTVVADAITAAGRALAVDQSNGADPIAIQLAANNTDMVNFRVDWIKAAPSLMTRGETEGKNGTFWAESLNFMGFMSTATV